MPRTLRWFRGHIMNIASPFWTGAGVPVLPHRPPWGSRGIARSASRALRNEAGPARHSLDRTPFAPERERSPRGTH